MHSFRKYKNINVPATLNVKLDDGVPVPLGLLAVIYKYEQVHNKFAKSQHYERSRKLWQDF